MSSLIPELVLTHVLQFTIAIMLVGLVAFKTSRKWPHFTFLILMLALVKCLVPPIIASPAGLFTLNPSIALDGSQRLQAESSVERETETVTLRERPTNKEEHLEVSQTGWFASVYSAMKSTVHFCKSNVIAGLIAIWIGGILFFVSKSILALRLLSRRIRDRASAPSAKLIRLVQELKARLNIERDIRIVVTSDNLGPGCIGIRRPTLVIPRLLVDNLPSSLLRPIVAHELVHCRRGDVFWGYVQYVCQVIWWFHPLVWWAGRAANRLCERCVDAEVLSSIDCSPSKYGESLVHVLQFKRVLIPVPIGQPLSAADVTSERLELLKDARNNGLAHNTKVCWLALTLLACVCLPGMSWHGSSTKSAGLSLTDMRSEVFQHLASERWQDAEAMLLLVSSKGAAYGETFYLRGYAAYAQGKFDTALSMYRKASLCTGVRTMSLYNCGRAAAHLGLKKEALDYIDQAITEGFYCLTRPSEDPALSRLATDSAFQSLEQRFNANAVKYPRIHTSLEYLTDACTEYDSRRRGIKVKDSGATARLRHFDWPAPVLMSELGDPPLTIQLDAFGLVEEVRGTIVPERIQLFGSSRDLYGNKTIRRITISTLPGGMFEQYAEQTSDGGNNWMRVARDGTVHPSLSAPGAKSRTRQGEPPLGSEGNQYEMLRRKKMRS